MQIRIERLNSFGGVVFTKLRSTLGRTHRQTDKAKTICPADISQAGV